MEEYLHGQRIFVISVADIAAYVLGVGPVVSHALGIMDVAVLWVTARAYWVGDILEVNEDETCTARTVTWCCADGDGIVFSLMDNDIVSSADWEISEETSNVLCITESDGTSRINVQKLPKD